MKGLTVVSTPYAPPYITDRLQILFDLIKEEFGFPIIYTDNPLVPSDVDVLFVALQRTYNRSMMNLEHLDRRVKMIGMLGDLHSLDMFHGNGTKMMKRYDVILSHSREAFEKLYPQFVYKTVFFPTFFGTHERYCSLPFREIPETRMKCLLAGAITPVWQYPLRAKVAGEGDSTQVDHLPHPGCHPYPADMKLPKIYMGARFARLLNQYYCAVVDTYTGGGGSHAPMRRVPAKHVEISAAGALLLAQPCADAEEMGFVPWETIVPVEEENVLSQIRRVLSDPEKYDRIRRAGMDVARSRHSVQNRMGQFRGVMANL